MSSYLGVPPQSGFITTAKQRVTSSTNNYVDLDHSISSLADVIVWVNSVKQDSTNLTLTTSTRITLGGTLVSSDVCEIAYLGKAVATQTPDTGTVTNDMLSGSIANSKLANSSITLNGSAVSLGGSATVGGDNTPAFMVYKSASQDLSDNAFVKVTFDTEVYDTDSAFASDKFTVPSGEDGKYRFTTQLYWITNSNTLDLFYVTYYVNGSIPSIVSSTGNSLNMWSNSGGAEQTVMNTTTLDLSAGDYVEVYGKLNVNSGLARLYSAGNYFMGEKLIGV